VGSTPNHRNEADQSAPLGIATTRYGDRIAAAIQGAGHASVKFDTSQAVCGAGVLFLLPALLSQGLLKTKEVYQMPASHYYGLESVILTLAFMALARIKNPEQLKQCKPGEIGRIIGLDRIPEVSCLRDKIKILSAQKQAQKLNLLLIDHWYNPSDQEEGLFLYIDGHVRIYYGAKAHLPSKFISRQKLCLSATTEYWVNDAEGQPVMMVMGELTEKLQTAIEDLIIPQLQQTVLLPTPPPPAEQQETKTQQEDPIIDSPQIEQQPKRPVCTFIFDREAYQPTFFQRLWITWQIAIITYRKNVKDIWEPECFTTTEVTVLDQKITMQLCERKVTLDGIDFREIRRLSEGGHQTSVITNNLIICMAVVAGRMFGRWVQENFFRYLIMDYDFDKMIEFGTIAIDQNKEVVNPLYRKVNHQLKKEREKTKRLKALQYGLAEQSIDANLEDIPALTQKQMGLMEKIEQHQLKEQQIESERNKTTARIQLKDMPEQQRYNRLKPESKMLMNIIKMICYRAETAVANLLTEFFIRSKEEKRMLVKQIIKTSADLIPDLENKTLTVVLHSLSAPRFNIAADKLAKLLTETQSIFPGTQLRIIFKTTAEETAIGKDS
jgi:hypothetical protein